MNVTNMTETLQSAFVLASRLPDAEQNRIAAWLLAEMESERRWDKLFERSQDTLAELAQEALEEHRQGKTKEWPTG